MGDGGGVLWYYNFAERSNDSNRIFKRGLLILCLSPNYRHPIAIKSYDHRY